MKQCPVCRTNYTDDSLSFCLNDGATLVYLSNEQETVLIKKETNPMRINMQTETPTSFQLPPIAVQPPTRGISALAVVAIVGILLVVVLGLVGLLAYISLKPDRKDQTVSTTPTATPKDETNALKEKIANLEKKVANQPTPPPANTATPVTTPGSNTTTVRVNSPGDGFLALRSEPNSESGERLAKIPHGININLTGCQSFYVTIGSRRGRWCRTSYAGQEGWVFDAWLDY